MNLKILILTLFTFSIQRKHALKKKFNDMNFELYWGQCINKESYRTCQVKVKETIGDKTKVKLKCCENTHICRDGVAK